MALDLTYDPNWKPDSKSGDVDLTYDPNWKPQGILGGLGSSLKRGIDSTVDYGKISLTDNPDEIAGIVSENIRNRPQPSAAQQKMNAEIAPYAKEASDAQGIVGNIGAYAKLYGKRAMQLAENPREFAGMVAENLPNSAPGIAGMVAGGAAGAATPVPFGAAIGGVVGGTAGGYKIEQGSSMFDQVVKEAQARGIDTNNKPAMSAMIAEKYPEFLKASQLKGVGTAGTDAVLNVATLGVAGIGERALAREARSVADLAKAGKMTGEEAASAIAGIEAKNAARNTIGQKALRGAGVAAGEMAGESLSEAAGQQLAYGKLDPLDVVDEGLLAFGQGVGMASGRKFISPLVGATDKDSVTQEIERARAFATALNQSVGGDVNAVPTLITDLGPLQQRIDDLHGIGNARMNDAERAKYEQEFNAAFGEVVGYTTDKDGMEIPFTMGDYLNSQVRSADITRDRPKAANAAQQSESRLQQVADEETAGYVAPEIPVVGTLSAVANMAIKSGAHAQNQMQQAMQAALAKQGKPEKANGPIAAATDAQVATQGAQGAGGNVPGSAGVPSPSPAGNQERAGNGAEVATPGLRPAVSAGIAGGQAANAVSNSATVPALNAQNSVNSPATTEQSSGVRPASADTALQNRDRGRADRDLERNDKSERERLLGLAAPTVNEANGKFNHAQRFAPDRDSIVPALLTNGELYLRSRPENADKAASLLGDGWRVEELSKPELKKGDRFKDAQGKTWEVWTARTSLVEAFPVIDGKIKVSRDDSVRFATDDKARRANPEARSDVFPLPKEKTPVTPQLLVGDPERYIKVAADSIQELRRVDVYRVLIESNRSEFRLALADYIKGKRPDLAGEVDAVLADAALEAKPTPTVADIDSAIEGIFDGTVSLADYKAAFNGLMANKEAIVTELGKMTIPQLHERFGKHPYGRQEKKGDIVERAFEIIRNAFALRRSFGPNSYTFSNGGLARFEADKLAALTDMVNASTAEDLKAFADEIGKTRAARQEKIEAAQDPKTIEDFDNALRLKKSEGMTFAEARMSLTTEQRAEYDRLKGIESRNQRKARADQQKTDVRVASQTTEGQVIETKHTKTGDPLFVVKAAERVERDVYAVWNATAKRMGGYYSAFRGNGAVPGFQFKTRENADAFLAFIGGNAEAAKEAVQERRDAFADDRSQSAVERLNEMAERLEEKADESLGRERKANTERRARFAASAEAAANAEKAMAKTMRRIAEAISNGTAQFLDRVRQKAQIEYLASVLRTAKDSELRTKYPSYADQEKHKGEPATGETADYAEFPQYAMMRSDLANLARKMISLPNMKMLGQRILKVADDTSAAYTAFAKEHLLEVSRFGKADGSGWATFSTLKDAERSIELSNLAAVAVPLQIKRGEYRIVLSPSEAINRGIWKGDDRKIYLSADIGEEIVEKLGKLNRKYGKRRGMDAPPEAPWQFENAYNNRKRLAGMGIEQPWEFRAALREFAGLKEAPKEADKIKAMERAMIGRKNDGLDFFPTPAETAQAMIDAAEVQEGMSVLEPSAGMGHIAEQIRDVAGIDPDVIEFNSDRRELLEAKGFNVIGQDFLDLTPRSFTYGDVFRDKDGVEGIMRGSGGMGSNRVGFVPLGNDERMREWRDRDELTGVRKSGYNSGYDRIIMNPPFSNRRDAEHVQHAYSLLKPGGRIVSIMGEGVFFGQDKKAVAFREWLEEVGGTSEKLDEGTFLDPSLPVNTGTNARMVVIDKPAGESAPVGSDKRNVGLKMAGDSGLGNATIAPTNSIKPIADILATENAVQVSVKGGNSDVLRNVANLFGKQIIFFRTVDAGRSENADVGAQAGRTGPDAGADAAGNRLPGSDFVTNGFVNPGRPNLVFLNVDSSNHLLYIAGHEVGHTLRMDDPALWADMAKQLQPLVRRWSEYKANMGQKLDSDAAYAEELFGDIIGQNFLNQAFWNDLAKENKSLFKRIAQAAVRVLNKAMSLIVGQDVSIYVSDMEQARAVVSKTLAQYSDNAGKGMYQRYADKLDQGYVNKRMVAWHGTPHDFDQFSLDKIGTGEGAQAYGYGLYFAGSNDVAEWYRKNLSGSKDWGIIKQNQADKAIKEFVWPVIEKSEIYGVRRFETIALEALQNQGTLESHYAILNERLKKARSEKEKAFVKRDIDLIDAIGSEAYSSVNAALDSLGWKGRLYQVELAPSEDEYLDWDKPLSEQSELVRNALGSAGYDISGRSSINDIFDSFGIDSSDIKKQSASAFYKNLSSEKGSDKAASDYLHSIGIRGIRYLDGSSRRAGEGNYNFVIFNDADVTISAKYNKSSGSKISPADKAIYGMAAEGKSAAEILKFIASASRSPFNRQVAKLLLKTGINPTITVGDGKGWKFNAGEGNKYAAGYDPKKNMISLFKPGAAERNMLHELIHAATIKALGKKGLASAQMKALFRHVEKNGKSVGLFYDQKTKRGIYGMANIDEFIAEAFSNPKFQEALKQVSAMPVGGNPSSAWDWFVRVVRGILGLKQGQDNALSQALDIGIGVMRENMRLNEGSADVRYNAAPGKINQTDTEAFKRWFGDSAVVDSDGKPLRVFHGTASDITAFDIGRSGESTGNTGFYGAGAYFSEDADYASGFSFWARRSDDQAPNVVPVYLSLKNPAYINITPRSQAASEKSRATAEKIISTMIARGTDQAVVDKLQGFVSENKFEPFMGTLYNALGGGTGTTALLKEAGFDGVTIYGGISGKEKLAEAVAFDPTQIKSAIGNNGDFDQSNPDIRYNVADDGWSVSEPSKMDDLIYALQDKQIDMKRVVQSIMRTGKKVKDEVNAYLQEELFHGRAAKGVKDFLDFELRPLLKQMQEAKVDMGDFEEYLWNRHAEERNKQIAKINPDMPDGGSGIETAKARAYLAGLSAEQRKTFEMLAAKVEAMNRQSQRVLVESGLEKQSTIDAWNGAYQHYVPLQRDDVDSGHVGTGKGFSVRGSSSKRAMGSGKKVVDIIANLTMQRERNIVRAEKNRVSNALLGLAVQNPNPDFWKVDQAPKERVVQEKAIYTVLDSDGNKIEEFTRMDEAERLANKTPGASIDQTWGDRVTERVTPGFTSRDNVLLTRINGEDHYVIFNEQDERAMRMAAAMKNLDMDNLGRVLSVVGKATRYLASINTQYNPIFGVINLVRDTQGALINLSSTPLAGEQKRVLGYTKDALVGIYKDIRAHRAGGKPSSNWAALFEEFQKEGGQTGYRDQYANAEARAESIKSELEQFKDGKAKQLARGLFGWLSDYNETMENAVRLAAYKAAKDKGMSNQQAASLAKNITVNFNRKGQMATQVGALYAFFNASVQGSARIAETLFEQHGGDIKNVRLSKKGKQILAGGIMLGAMQALLLAAAGFDDDEPPEFIRERNLILPIGGGKYLTLAMPLGLHVIPGIGRIATEFVLSGGKDPLKRIAAFGSMFADAFNPIGSAGWSLQTITPSVVDPFAALAENKDFTGKEIYREDFNKLNPTPGHARAKDVATIWSRYISEALNFMTGGTEFKPGMFSPSPDSIDYLIAQAGGGVMREANKVAQTVGATATGEDLPLYKIPLVGRFVGDTAGQSGQSQKFYDAIKQINMHEAQYKGLIKDGRSAEAREYLAENPAVRLIMAGNHAELAVRKLRTMKRDLVENDADQDKIRAIDARITETMRRFNERAGAFI